MTKSPPAILDFEDIQGLVARGYPNLGHAKYLVLEATDAGGARAWLAKTAVTPAKVDPQKVGPQMALADRVAVQLAFTSHGLVAVGLPQQVVEGFAGEFQEGMATPHRQRILGDEGASAPENWRWGASGREHILLMLFAGSARDMEQTMDSYRPELQRAGLRVLQEVEAAQLPDRKEHFGFHDGIAQPTLEGLSKARGLVEDDILAAGEIILGYVNEYGKLPESPLLDAALDPYGHLQQLAENQGTLPPDADMSKWRDFGRNGTYLVLRQISQDVRGFWADLDRRSGGDPDARLRLASKFVGRWPSGAPMVVSPDRDDERLKDEDGFTYAADPHGDKCPVGSHIRRANPRDSLAPGPKESSMTSSRHRILRRGRAYGPPVAASMQPEDFLQASDDGQERGLIFICLNASIARQFEFIQQTWINNPKFAGLHEDPDPLVGNHDGTGAFSVQRCPVRHRETALQPFVQMRGGAYFFLPSLRAIRYLASLGEVPSASAPRVLRPPSAPNSRVAFRIRLPRGLLRRLSKRPMI